MLLLPELELAIEVHSSSESQKKSGRGQAQSGTEGQDTCTLRERWASKIDSEMRYWSGVLGCVDGGLLAVLGTLADERWWEESDVS